MTLVVPVRLAAHDRITQTTSREMTASSLLVASQRAPREKEIVSLRLYLPDAREPAGATGQIRPASGGTEGFWVDLLDTIGEVGERIRALVARLAPSEKPAREPHRLSPRYPTSIAVAIQSGERRFAARVIDLSSSGAFIRCQEKLDIGTVVGMKLLLPDHDEEIGVNARIMHATKRPERHAPWLERGVGLQFIDGDDLFRSQIEAFIQRLARR